VKLREDRDGKYVFIIGAAEPAVVSGRRFALQDKFLYTRKSGIAQA
jgi:hypothetical protein